MLARPFLPSFLDTYSLSNIVILLLESFSHQRYLMVFRCSFSNSKSLQIYRTLLRILADSNNAVFWQSSRVLLFKFSGPGTNPLVILPREPITIGIVVTFMLHFFFQFPIRVKVRIPLFAFFQFYNVVHWDSKVRKYVNSPFFLLIITKSGRLAEISWSVCNSKFHRSLCVLFSRTDNGLSVCCLFVWSNFNFLHNFQWITLPSHVMQSLIFFLC